MKQRTTGNWHLLLALALSACQALPFATSGASHEGRVNGDYYANVQISANGRSYTLKTADGKPLGSVVVQVGLNAYRAVDGKLALPASALADLKRDSRGFFRIFTSGYVPKQVWIGAADQEIVLVPVRYLVTEQLKPDAPTRVVVPGKGIAITVPAGLVAAPAPIEASIYETAGGQPVNGADVKAKVQKLLHPGTYSLQQACTDPEQPFPCVTLPQGLGLMLSINEPISTGKLTVTYALNTWLRGWDGQDPAPWVADPAGWSADDRLLAASAARIKHTWANIAALPADVAAAYRQVLDEDYGVAYDDITGTFRLTIPLDGTNATAADGFIRTQVAGMGLLGVTTEVTVMSPVAGTLPPAALPALLPSPAGVGPIVAGDISTLIANNAGNVIGNNGGSVVSNNGGALTGKVKGGTPLISNNGGSFNAKYGLLSYVDYPWVGAAVQLVDATGAIKSAAGFTDASGTYQLNALPPTPAKVFVQATLAGERLVTVADAPGATQVVADIDPATTLAAAWVMDEIKAGRATFASFTTSGFAADVQQLRGQMDQPTAVAASQTSLATAAATARNLYASASYTPQAVTGQSPAGPPPSISLLTPSSAARGASVIIDGANFAVTPGAVNTVTFNGTPGTVTAASANQLTVTVPAGAKNTGSVVVAVSGQTSAGSAFVVDGPQINSQSLSYGDAYAVPALSILLTGSGFSATLANNHVTVGGLTAAVLTASQTQLKIKVPNGGDGQIIVTVGGQTSNPGNFTDTGAGSGGGSGCPPPPYLCP